jgi:cellulose synthase/poly-beta-1,6-N-acetylglucosamine synthase-like glycosyltransferase
MRTEMHALPHPSLAIVIPTMGRPILLRTLDSLLALAGIEATEIVVVGIIPDEALQQRLDALMRVHPNVRHEAVRFETGDASRKRNAGAVGTTAPILAFLDDDVHVPSAWLASMLACFEDPEVALVSGPSLVPDDLPQLARLAGLALSSRAAGDVSARYLKGGEAPRRIRWSGIIGCNMLFRRSVFEALGGFDPGFYPGEEMLASFRVGRLGHALVFNPGAPVYHYPKQTFRGFWRQIFRYGATRIRLMRAGVEVQLGPLVPGLWVAANVLLGFGSIFHPLIRAVWVAELMLYALVILVFTMEVVLKTRRPGDTLLLLMQPFMHLSYGAGIWYELARPDRDLSDALGRPTD